MSLWGTQNKNLAFHTFTKGKPDKKFMAMFVGFMDGDGYFDVGEQKQYNKKTKAPTRSTIRIRLVCNVKSRDLALLEYFVEVLKVGKIDTMSGDRDQVRVIFSKKDLITTILPLIKEYNLEFLTSQRLKQFALVNYILDNTITNWDNVNFKESPFVVKSVSELAKLDYFCDWLIGFTIAEGSFGFKARGDAFFQLKQSGEDNVDLLKAASFVITGKHSTASFKVDSFGGYQLALSSGEDMEHVISFFSSGSHHALYGYKLEQYQIFISGLRSSKRYGFIGNKFIEQV